MVPFEPTIADLNPISQNVPPGLCYLPLLLCLLLPENSKGLETTLNLLPVNLGEELKGVPK